MEELAKAWVEGLNIDWKDLFYSEKSRYKLSLPGYQFQRKKYWLDTVNMSLKSEYTWDFTADDIFFNNHRGKVSSRVSVNSIKRPGITI
jgi:acyl transferase domain-containing protein